MIQFTLPDDVLEYTPVIHETAFVARGAQVMGNVELN